MKILLACSAGMSTSLLEKALNDYMAENGIKGSAIAKGSESAKGELDKYDVVLLGPQVRFMLPSFKSLAGDVPVEVIPAADYAMAKGENVYNFAKKLTGK